MIDVPLSNPVRFRPLTGHTDTNFDNIFADYYRGVNRAWAQMVAWDDWTIQVVSDVDYYDEEGVSSDLTLFFEYTSGDTEYTPDVPIVTEKNGLYYYNFNIRPNFTGCFKIYVQIFSTETNYFESEWIKGYITDAVREANTDLKKIEWFNQDNAFSANYVESGFVAKAYIEAKLYYMAPTGEAVIYDNLGDEIKLKEVVQRVFKFDCELPDYLCEILTLAMAHDRFFINDVEFVSNKKPTLTQYGRSNWYKFEAELKQNIAIGLNTHDTGFDCDALTTTKIMNLTDYGKTSNYEVIVPADYMVHVITATYVSGTTTDMTVGTTEGGDDVMSVQTITAVNDLYTVVIHEHYTASTTLYVTLDGDAAVDVNFQLIKNIEE